MSVIYLLIAVSIFIAIGFFIAYKKEIKTRQYDDDYTPTVRMLFDDKISKTTKNKIKKKKKKQI